MLTTILWSGYVAILQMKKPRLGEAKSPAKGHNTRR